jgi:hypothetical protein
MKLVLATANAGKVAEISHAIGSHAVLIPRPPEVKVPDETGGVSPRTPRIKARAICEATGAPAVSRSTPQRLGRDSPALAAQTLPLGLIQILRFPLGWKELQEHIHDCPPTWWL